MGKSQRAKGQRGERAAATALAEHIGGEWRRGTQTRGGQEEPDVVSADFPGLHIEVKVGKRPPVHPARRQAVADHEPGTIPLVLDKVDRGEWWVSVRLVDLVQLSHNIAARHTWTPTRRQR
jgi:hypothetical protein